ncbi:hypothetical protein EDD18DRAFT_1391177 [Armillaria luteobubalina]|uniref:Uncharacterized protein n=1 Tax=Armillaria luteobubalina TaxID=153913 RepID=A0AA39P091_9AGAR|nr:hypothetical protein EDD18DRAFT_1391177 [Armillaria luteobubalina]
MKIRCQTYRIPRRKGLPHITGEDEDPPIIQVPPLSALGLQRTLFSTPSHGRHQDRVVDPEGPFGHIILLSVSHELRQMRGPTQRTSLSGGWVASRPAALANLHNTPVPDDALLNTVSPPILPNASSNPIASEMRSTEDLDEEAEAECDDDDAEFPENSVWAYESRLSMSMIYHVTRSVFIFNLKLNKRVLHIGSELSVIPLLPMFVLILDPDTDMDDRRNHGAAEEHKKIAIFTSASQSCHLIEIGFMISPGVPRSTVLGNPTLPYPTCCTLRHFGYYCEIFKWMDGTHYYPY